MGSTKTGGRTVSKKAARAAERKRRAKRKRLLILTGAGLASLAVIAGLVSLLSAGTELTGSTETQAWDLPVLQGEGRVALADFHGKPTVVAFFASWCTICRRELPGFAHLSQALDGQVNFVGINTMNNGQGLGFAREMGIDIWPLAQDIGGVDGRQLATNFGARGSPTTVIYDADGRVVDVTLGRLTASQLSGKLQQFFGIGS
ncbi:MAG: TlpA family protein disulfide reductase [Acidimicrobiia bacterium]